MLATWEAPNPFQPPHPPGNRIQTAPHGQRRVQRIYPRIRIERVSAIESFQRSGMRMMKHLEGRGSWNCSSWRRLRRPPHKEQGKGHEVKQTLEMSQHFWESGLALTCPVGGMGRAGLRGDNGGDVSGSSGAAHGKTGRAETGQHTTTGNAKGYSMHLIQDCRDTGNKSRDGMGTAPGVLQPFHETRAIPIHHPPCSGGLLLLAPLDAAVDLTVCVLSMFWLDLECRKRCWKLPGCGQWCHL